MLHRIRLSRVTHPRASLIAIILLAAVFGLFGAIASALHPEPNTVAPAAAPAATSELLDATAALVSNRMLGS